MAKAFNAGFQRIVHRVLPVPVGSRDRVKNGYCATTGGSG
jgi:hypothetical protein